MLARLAPRRRQARQQRANSGAGGRKADGKRENGGEPAEGRVDEPEGDRRQENGAARLHAAVVAGSFAAPLRRRTQGEQ